MAFKITGNHLAENSKPLAGLKRIKQEYYLKKTAKADSFEREKEDKSNNGKFDITEAAKNFFKGVISPVTAVLKHPLMTAGVVGATIAICSVIPVLAPIMTVGFLGASALQLGKGCYNVAKNIKNGNYDDAEKSFESVGQGTVGTALSLLGLKQSAQVAKEAKMMQELNVTTLTKAQKDAVALEIKGNSIVKNLKEISSLITTKQGRQAFVSQFKPSNIKQRTSEIIDKIKGTKVEQEKTVETKRAKAKQDFKRSTEGRRRASMTDEQIQAEVQARFDEAFDELGIPQEQRPKLKIEFDNKLKTDGGGYSASRHRLDYNPEGYREGVFEMDEVIMHEATHCKEALIRAGIPQDRADIIVKEELLSRIRNGESERIIVKNNFFGPDMMKPPKMSEAMRSDFAQFAKDNLYSKSKDLTDALDAYVNRPKSSSVKLYDSKSELSGIIDNLKAIMKKHPEFKQQYANEQEALDILMEYSFSHNSRYNYFANVSVGKSTPNGPIKVPELTGEALEYAEKSLINHITTQEGNGRITGFSGICPTESSFNQYQFSPEEVLAQQNGHEFAIKSLKARLEQLRASGELTPSDEAYLTTAIEKAKATIEYKTKGLEYYEHYTKMINNPDDVALKAVVDALKKELKVLEDNIDPKYETIMQTIKEYVNPDRATTQIPLNVIYELVGKLKEVDNKQ